MSQALQLFTLNHYSLFQFKACYQGEIIADIILPNDHKLWVKGVSLGVYSRSYDFHTRTQDFTDIGRAIYEYKYFRNLPLNRKNEAISFFENKMINFYKLDEDVNSSLFDTCIAVPSNNVAGVSLPLEVIKKLKLRFDWLQNCSELLHKTREIPVIKDLNDSNERKEILKGAYAIEKSSNLEAARGILIVDDIYDTGATIREVARTIKRNYPGVPRYALTFAHLKGLWG